MAMVDNGCVAFIWIGKTISRFMNVGKHGNGKNGTIDKVGKNGMSWKAGDNSTGETIEDVSCLIEVLSYW